MPAQAADSAVEDAGANFKFFGHCADGFLQTRKTDGLGFEFCAVSFSGHRFIFGYFPAF